MMIKNRYSLMTSLYNDCLTLCEAALVKNPIVQQFIKKLQELGDAPTGLQIDNAKRKVKKDESRANEEAAWRRNLDKDGKMVPPEKLQSNSETAEFIAIGKSIYQSKKRGVMNYDELVEFRALFEKNDMEMKQPSKKQKVTP